MHVSQHVPIGLIASCTICKSLPVAATGVWIKISKYKHCLKSRQIFEQINTNPLAFTHAFVSFHVLKHKNNRHSGFTKRDCDQRVMKDLLLECHKLASVQTSKWD